MTEEEQKEPTPDVPDNTTGLIDSAREQADRVEAANKKHEELLNRQEALDARRALAGKTDAGQVPEKPKEETNAEYAERVERGEI